MMPSPRTLNLSASVIFAALSTIALINQSVWAAAAEPAAKGKSKQSSHANVTPETPNRDITEWTKNRSASARAWNRAALRPEPASATPLAKLTRVPGIRQINASGSEDGEVSTAVASEAASSDHSVPAESDDAAPTSSLSVREQLLNALRKQRESTVGAPPLSIPGSLTIMNSPAAPSQRSSTGQHPEPQIAAPNEMSVQPPVIAHSDSTVPAPPHTAKSSIGLTRTLEADLQSTDPYVRDRAQRYLRLEMQLLKLRANQAAAAELPTPDVSHVPESAAEHAPEPSGNATSPTDASNRRELPDQPVASHSPENAVAPNLHPDEHGHHSAEKSESVHPKNENLVPPPHGSTTDNVVDGPIDRLGLANNLFATGEYPLALEMYQQTATADLTVQQSFWVEYQLANCQRRLGNLTEASNRYRKLAEHPEAGWLSQQAHWWVETLAKIRSLEKALADNAFDQQRAAIEEVEKAKQVIPNPSAAPASDPSIIKESAHDAYAR
ncbi:MAG: hypothetical protein WKF77_27015 [Planctomycetaceae bacterium]